MPGRWTPTALRRILDRRPQGATEAQADDPAQSLELVSLDAADRAIVERSLPYTMTGVMRLRAVVDAVRYCVAAEVPGALAECGVWRGGSVLAMVATLQALGVEDRDVYLYDTFEGMTKPSESDVSPVERPALEAWQAAERADSRVWPEVFGSAAFNEQGVRELLLETGYPEERLHFVRGPVEETIPAQAPAALALLRLDTDWYESTLHEMRHLYPRLGRGGVLIIDDYGHWEGARRAVDEYLGQLDETVLLTAVDYTARVAVKR